MTTIEKTNCSSKLLRPTDLSLKNNLNSKLNCRQAFEHGDNNNKRHVIVHAQHEFQQQKGDRTAWGETQESSPIALVIGRGGNFAAVTSMAGATSPGLDSRLVVLDSLFPPANCKAAPSPVSNVFEELAPRPRDVPNGDWSNVELRNANSRSNGQLPYSAEAPGHRVAPSRAKSRSPKSGSPTGRGTKRKGGWKFHDLSDESDGLGRRKRAYNHNKLENEILQLYQDRVYIKEVPGGPSSKGDHLVVIEPSYISDPDLVKYNTGLRVVFNKKQGTYQLQVLPYTIEQGSLNNKSSVLNAVAKMLGDNGSVLCPGIVRALLTPQVYLPQHNSGSRSPEPGGKTTRGRQNGKTQDEHDLENYWGRWKMDSSPDSAGDRSSPESGCESSGTPVTPTDRLLLTLNKELAMNQKRKVNVKVDNSHAAARCLLWHAPVTAFKGKKTLWPAEAKWCSNCVRRMLKQ